MTGQQLGPATGDWHLVGAAGEPAFQNSWVSLASAPEPPGVRFMKDADGTVYVEGAVKSGTADTTITTLPAGYRPKFTLNGLTCRNGGTGGIFGLSMDSSGSIATLNTAANGNIAFAFSFKAEQ